MNRSGGEMNPINILTLCHAALVLHFLKKHGNILDSQCIFLKRMVHLRYSLRRNISEQSATE